MFKKSRQTNDNKKNLYSVNEYSLSTVTDIERDFFWSWCKERHIDDVYIVHALVLWIKSKRKISVSFLLRECNKELYMKLCVHLSLKWNGYDELYKCDFLHDLKCTYPQMTSKNHWEMEFELLNSLGWEIN